MTDEHHMGEVTARRQLLSPQQLEAILRYDTCTIANAIESFGVRLCNKIRPGLNCVTGSEQRILGYAATFKVRSSDPPVVGGKFRAHGLVVRNRAVATSCDCSVSEP